MPGKIEIRIGARIAEAHSVSAKRHTTVTFESLPTGASQKQNTKGLSNGCLV